MGRLIPLAPLRPTLPTSTAPDEPSTDSDAARDHDLAPIAALLFVASLARVVHALWTREPFDVEPTLALACVLGVPWLSWLEHRKRG